MKKNIKFLIAALFILAIGLTGCDDDDKVTLPAPPDNTSVKPVSANNKVIYEVNVRNFSRSGNFEGLKNDLPRLKQLGIDVLWLMPIHPIGVLNRSGGDGSLGSPYAVKDYKAVNPDYGTLDDFKALVKAAHDKGMEIWIDWVANHTACDHSWVTDHLMYYASKEGQRPYSPENWTDAYQLDFANPELRTAMIDAMKFWVQETNIDGFRLDAATYVPVSFWQQARTEVDAIKKIGWLAEADDTRYIPTFDCDYAWGFNDKLNDFITNKEKTLTDLKNDCWDLFYNSAYTNKQKMIYLTNHDLNAYHGTEFTRYRTKVFPLTVLQFTIYDMPLIYNGQEIGWDKAMSMTHKDVIVWDYVNTEMSDLIHKLTYLKRTTPALESGAGRGALYHYSVTDENVYAYSRTKGNSEVVVVLNFGNTSVDVDFSGNYPKGTFKDYINGGSREFGNGQRISLPANGYAIYVK